MKKILPLCLIACTLTISTNSFGMLTQTARIRRAKFSKSYTRQQKLAITQSGQKEENNKEYRYSAESIKKN